MVIPRDSFRFRLIRPFFSSARRWHITPFGDLMSNALQMSRIVGG
jgi:hypothetical protein